MRYGEEKMYKFLREEYFWHGMRKRISAFTKSCDLCARLKPLLFLHDMLTHIQARHPFEVVCMDIQEVGPSSAGYTANLICMDAFSRFLQCVPLRRNTAREVILALQKCIQFSAIPQRILCDLGRCFDSLEFRQFAKQLSIELVFAPAGHHASNGLAEVAVRSVNTALKFFARDDFRKWPEILPLCVSAINLLALRSGCSATEALYGMRSHFPGSLEPLLRHKSLSNFEKNRLSKRARIMQKRLRLCLSQGKTFNRGKTCPTFRPGQKVYVAKRANSNRRAVKFCAKFRPAVIIEASSPVIYRVKQIVRGKQRKRIVHISMIKPSFKTPKCLQIPDDRYLSVSPHVACP